MTEYSGVCLFIGDVSGVTGLPNMLGMEAGSILLSPVQASALGMSLLQGSDGAINLLNSIQVGTQTEHVCSIYKVSVTKKITKHCAYLQSCVMRKCFLKKITFLTYSSGIFQMMEDIN